MQAAKEIEDLRAVLEDLAAKVEDLEAAVREKEATRNTLRDAFAQVAGAHCKSYIPVLYHQDASLAYVQNSILCCSWCSSLHCDWLWHGSESYMHGAA